MYKCSFVVLLLFLFQMADAQKMVVATYNVRYDSKDDSLQGDGWQRRYPVIAGLIQFHNWDLFGVQEAKANQVEDLTTSLPGYAYTGVGRDDGKTAGEFSAIFYKKEKYELLQSGTFWLSPTNTRQPNKGWDAALPRICSWGKFKETKTGFSFYFFNLHMDHIGVVARRESARLVLDTVQKMAGNTPAILTGDFNVDQHNESYALINNSGVLKDAYSLSPVTFAPNGTFNGFNIRRFTNSRIDHIFLSKAFAVHRYAVLTHTYWAPPVEVAGSTAHGEENTSVPRLPSDHYPVMAEVIYQP